MIAAALCSVALVLLQDVSGSVNDDRYKLQRDGTADAFLSPDVMQSVRPDAPLAITVIEWSSSQQTVVPWRILRSTADLQKARNDLAQAPRVSSALTGLGDALAAGVKAFESAPCDAERQVIDISGDGATNTGQDPAPARAAAQKAGITINGLPIWNEGEPLIADYYRNSVVTPDGFVVEAHGFADVARAMTHKLSAEISGILPTTEWAAR